jgi:small subunit ribosomal protein S2
MKLSLVDFFKAGAHFGHKTRYWNPKMAEYIFDERQGIHVIDLEQTITAMASALDHVGNLVFNGGRVIFVGTKWVSRNQIAEMATQADMPYVNYRWPGGMLTNFKTMKHSIKRLLQLEEQLENGGDATTTKKEKLQLEREQRRLEQSFGGIKKMNALPDAIIVMDVGHEQIAVQEAKKLGITVIGIVDTNNSPDDVDFVIPGNDDSHAAVKLYLKLFQEVIAEAKSRRPEQPKKVANAKGAAGEAVKIVRKSKKAAEEAPSPANEASKEQKPAQ